MTPRSSASIVPYMERMSARRVWGIIKTCLLVPAGRVIPTAVAVGLMSNECLRNPPPCPSAFSGSIPIPSTRDPPCGSSNAPEAPWRCVIDRSQVALFVGLVCNMSLAIRSICHPQHFSVPMIHMVRK
jgi:hypothetical protein